jgi:ketosteroid isomerase-like protein
VSENLDLVRSILADWERGDWSGADWVGPACEMAFVDGPVVGTWIGPTSMREGLRNVLSAWDDFSVVPEDFRELDDERVLVLVQLTGRGRTSGLEANQMRTKGVNLFRVRDGKVVRLDIFWDRDRALADLGVEE